MGFPKENFAGRHVMLHGARELRRDELEPGRVAWYLARLKTDPSGCLLWTGARNADGYGVLRVGTRHVLAHRLAVALERGAIASSLQVDHLCKTRLCCNVAHIRLATHEENSPGVYGRGVATRSPRPDNGVAGWGPLCVCRHAQLLHRGREHTGSCIAAECAKVEAAQ